MDYNPSESSASKIKTGSYVTEMNVKQTLKDGSQHEQTFKAEIIVVISLFNVGSSTDNQSSNEVEIKPKWPPSFKKIRIDTFGLVTIGFNTTMIQTSKESLQNDAVKIQLKSSSFERQAVLSFSWKVVSFSSTSF